MSAERLQTDPAALDPRTWSDGLSDAVGAAIEASTAEPRLTEVGTVTSVGRGVVRISGLPGVGSEELLHLAGRRRGMAFDLAPDDVGAILLDEAREVGAGSLVRRTGRVVDAPVGEELLGRVIDPTGRSLDRGRTPETSERRPIERVAPAILERAPVTVPLQTGLLVVDALVPVGRGQRELIVGDRQTGKTAIALDTIINQRGRDVRCVYCAIGLRSTAVARLVADLETYDALGHTIVVVASGDAPPGMKFVAPYAAMTMAEFFMEQGEDALVVFDDLTRHARAYRELALLLNRPPAREAYPGDIFYIHARLLERATHLDPERGGGSVTALPIVETHAQNISAYIPTNLISITDGQIYLSPQLMQQGVLPAVDVGRSVSRVGGKTQLSAYRKVAGDLRLDYSQFEELESFARFGTRLDEETRAALARGRRVREILKQPQYTPQSVTQQVAALVAVTEGLLDAVPLEQVGEARRAIQKAASEELEKVREAIESGQELDDEQREAVRQLAREASAPLTEEKQDRKEEAGAEEVTQEEKPGARGAAEPHASGDEEQDRTRASGGEDAVPGRARANGGEDAVPEEREGRDGDA
ncbi:MAG: alternate F1F0 ATPase, F1 subunit alpha [Candidatus Eisenbacteria bacterium]|nr:alternate F1F0 ATPase, F1 subunit alpha [Candidatus Eisenbacteria bacterium]